MRPPRTFALPEESLCYLTNPQILSALEEAMEATHVWTRYENTLHVPDCMMASKGEGLQQATYEQHSLEAAWEHLCAYCLDTLRLFLAPQDANVVNATMQLAWGLSLSPSENPIGVEEVVHEATSTLEHYKDTSLVLPLVQQKVDRDAYAQTRKVQEVAGLDPHRALHVHAALKMAGMEVPEVKQPDGLLWKNLSRLQGFRYAVCSASRALLDPTVDPAAAFLGCSGTTEKDLEQFRLVFEQVRSDRQRRLQDETRFLVALSTSDTQHPGLWWHALRLVAATDEEWSYLEISPSVKDLLEEEGDYLVVLGEVQKSDTSRTRELARTLLKDALLDSLLLEKGSLLAAARLLEHASLEVQEIAMVLLQDAPKESDLLQDDMLLRAAEFLNT